MLFDWQKKIVDTYRSRHSFGLFLDMGLGKTPLSLALAEVNQCTKVIVITINSKVLEGNISGSWYAWASKSEIPYKQFTKLNGEFDKEPSILVTNYESLYKRQVSSSIKTNSTRLRDELIDYVKSARKQKIAIIVDESHKMKNLQSKQTKAINQIYRECCTYCGSENVYTYLLTGTPFTNAYIDLYSQLKFLGCSLTKGQFEDSFCERGNIKGLLGWQQPIVAYKNIPQLFELVHKYAITIKTEEVLELPDKIYVNHVVDESIDFKMMCNEKFNSSEILKYASSRKIPKTTFDIDFSKSILATNPFYRDISYPESKWIAETTGVYWMRARQLSIGFQGGADDAIWYDRRRLNMLRRFLEENEDNYVLFYNYNAELIELFNICEELGYNIDVYCGSVKSMTFYSEYERQTESQRLTNKKNIIISNFASGSTGKNWQLYSKCIIFSIPVYSDWAQAIKRIHRTGQKETTFYHIFYQKNWLDYSMKASLEKSEEYSLDMFNSDSQRIHEIMSDKVE